MTKIEELLVSLLEIPSVTGQEKKIGEFLVSQLSGFEVEKQIVEKDRFNVIAKKGKPDVYFVVHMDTVPGDVSVKVTKDKIFGRGAIDNKGNIAGAIMAAKKLANIGLIFTVGEETNFDGAMKLKKRKGKFIVMEPTKLKVMSGQRGAVAFDILTEGIQMHSSLDFKKEDSAVYNLMKILSELYRKNWTAFNAIIPDGGEKDSIIAPFAKASIFLRPKSDKEYEEVLSFLKKFKRKRVKMKIKETIPPCESTLIKDGETARFFSELAFFDEGVLFGVGDIKNAHTPDEHVLRKDLNRLEEELLKLVRRLENM